MTKDGGRQPEGAEARSSGGEDEKNVFLHIFDRYLYNSNGLEHMNRDFSAWWEGFAELSWLPGSNGITGGMAGVGAMVPLVVAGAIVVAAPRLLSTLWLGLRVGVLNRPGTVYIGRARRENASRLKSWLLPGKPVFQHVADRLRVTKIIGTIGIGKTTLMAHLIKQDLKAGIGLVVIEMSGNLGGKVREYAELYDRKCYRFDPMDPTAMKWNPIAGPDKEKVAQRFVDIVCGDYATREQYFKQMNETMARPAVIAVKSYEEDHLGGEATIEDVVSFIENEEYRKKVLYLGKDEQTGRVTVNAHWLDDHTRKFYEQTFYNFWTSTQRREHAVGLANSIGVITAGTLFREALCPQEGELSIDLAAALEEGAAVIMRSPIEANNEESAATLAGWQLGTFEQTTEARESRRFVSLYLDEAHLILSERNFLVAQRFKAWIPMVRHYRVLTSFSYQAFSMLEYGLRQMLSNIARNTLVFGDGLGPDDLYEAERIAGSRETEVHERRTTRKKFIPFRILSSLDQSEMSGTRLEMKPRYSADEIRGMDPGEVLATLTRDNHTAEPCRIKVPREGVLRKTADRLSLKLRRSWQAKVRKAHVMAASAIEGARQDTATSAEGRPTDAYKQAAE